jgi:antitoxin PrlF
MQAIRFVKSFSRGQITIPKEIREELGVSEEFWMKMFVDNGKIVVEPVQKIPSKEEYLKKLLSLDTSWFTEEDYDDYKKIRQEADEHVERN